MRSFFAGVFCLGAFLFVWLCIAQGSFAWALPAILCIVVAGLLMRRRPMVETDSPGEEMTTTRDSRQHALQVAEGGGFLSIMARNWLKAYDQDPTVPPFGMRPYWTPTGPGGAPQFLTIVGFQGVEKRLEYVRHEAAEETLLAIMADDPNPVVRDAVRARLR